MSYSKRCSYFNCSFSYQSGSFFSFFKFPDDSRKELWYLHCGGEKFKEVTKVVKNIYICENHFRTEDLVELGGKKMLKKNAIPLPFEESFCRCTRNYIDPLCVPTLVVTPRPPPIKKKKSKVTEDFASIIIENNPFELEPPSPPYIVKREENVRTYIRDYTIPLIPERNTPSPSQFPEHYVDQRREPSTLPFRVEKESFLLIEKRKHSVENKETGEKKLERDVKDKIDRLLKDKTPEVKTFILSQFYHKKRQNWTKDEKHIFQKIYFKSPACFRELQNMGFSMPHVNSIMRWQGSIAFPVGLGGDMIALLKEKCEQMSFLDRKCVLLFDEMSCKMELEYSSKEDKIFGFKDLGDDKQFPSVANSVLLLMLRGLNSNWKQSIAYFIGKVQVDELVGILKNTLEQLLDIGFDVMAVTCDQGSSNQSAYKKFKCTKENPYTLIKDKKIMLLFDVPHLIKSFRNNLHKADIKVEDNIISWDILRKIYKEEKNHTLKACFNLTEKHIDPSAFDKLSVKLATQVFSLNVSAGIELGIVLNIFQPNEIAKAKYTAESFRRINNLFDNLNSVVRFMANPQRNAISDQEEGRKIIDNIKDCATWIENWIHLGKTRRPPSFDGMIQTINGVLLLWDELKKTQSYFITSHINQDPLENSISILRRNKGSYEQNPSVLRISRNLRQVAFQNFIPSTETGYNISNTENLVTEFTPSQSHITNDREELMMMSDEEKEETEVDEFFRTTIQSESELENNLSMGSMIQCIHQEEESSDETEEVEIPATENIFESNAVVYFAGYIAKRIFEKYRCDKCASLMISHEETPDHDTLIKLRAYETKKADSQYGNLTVPSKIFIKFVRRLINHFENEIVSQAFKKELLKQLTQSLPSTSNTVLCSTHETQVINFTLIVLIRFYSKKINRQLASSLLKQREKLKILGGL